MRAPALFVEMNGDRRETLGSAIAQFQLTLEAQDEPAIRQMREHLNAMVERLKATI